MTFKTTVRAQPSGTPLQGAFVFANVEEDGTSFTRFTDGAGYADVAILGPHVQGAHITFVVEMDGYHRSAQYKSYTGQDEIVVVDLVPFG